MNIAHFEAGSGIAGDMTVAALLDAGRGRGLSLDALRDALATVPLGHYGIDASPVEVDGVPALHFRVAIDHHHHHHHRHWSDIRRMLGEARAAGLPEGAFDRAMAIFEVLARAEAEVHQVDVDHVHFHEVGAVDSIVDIVGAAWCLDRLGIDACTVAPFPTGSGFVDTEHGRLAVPAPATALLIRGFDVKMGDGEGELVTPTGAAILAAMAEADAAAYARGSLRRGRGDEAPSRPAERAARVPRLGRGFLRRGAGPAGSRPRRPDAGGAGLRLRPDPRRGRPRRVGAPAADEEGAAGDAAVRARGARACWRRCRRRCSRTRPASACAIARSAAPCSRAASNWWRRRTAISA